jgi:hypothetical protein
MWLHSQDEEFRQKRDAILRLYYGTPCIDPALPGRRVSLQAGAYDSDRAEVG